MLPNFVPTPSCKHRDSSHYRDTDLFVLILQCEELLFCLTLGAIYIFSFFNAKEERTRYKYLMFYTFCFCENSAMILIWFFCANKSIWYYYPGIIGHYLAFFAGLFFMIIYYLYFHPTGIGNEQL